jgi:hypothetical protein
MLQNKIVIWQVIRDPTKNSVSIELKNKPHLLCCYMRVIIIYLILFNVKIV